MPACVRDVLEETLGVVLFQDQVIAVAKQMGGFSASQAETFRRAMSRKRSAQIMERYRQQFMDGAAARGVPPAGGSSRDGTQSSPSSAASTSTPVAKVHDVPAGILMVSVWNRPDDMSGISPLLCIAAAAVVPPASANRS